MAITKNTGRQDVLVAHVTVTYDDLTSGSAAEAVDVPPDAIYLRGYVDVKTAWDSNTSDVLDVGDGDDDDRYTSSQIDISSTGITELDTVSKQYAEKDTVDLTWTGTGTAPTQGELDLIFEYIVEDRAVETQV